MLGSGETYVIIVMQERKRAEEIGEPEPSQNSHIA